MAKICVDCKTKKKRNLILVKAVENAHRLCVKYAIVSGADVNTRTTEGSTPLLGAIRNENYKREKDRYRCVKLLVGAGADVNRPDSVGATALMAAIWRNDDKCTALLLKSGADVNVIDSQGHTPLICASLLGNINCVKNVDRIRS